MTVVSDQRCVRHQVDRGLVRPDAFIRMGLLDIYLPEQFPEIGVPGLQLDQRVADLVFTDTELRREVLHREIDVQPLGALGAADGDELDQIVDHAAHRVAEQQVLDLPLKDREFLQLTVLSEGVVNPPGGTRGDSLQQTGNLINVLGQRTGHNLFDPFS